MAGNMSYSYDCTSISSRHELSELQTGAYGFKRSKMEKRTSFGATTVLSEDDAQSRQSSFAEYNANGSLNPIRQLRNREKAREVRVQKKECVKQLQARIKSLEIERKMQLEQEELDAQANEQRISIRKAVLQTFLRNLTKLPSKENDERMWSCLVEPSSFWLKQPVTLFRGFNKSEIHPGPCRISRGVNGLIAEASSLCVMIKNIGCDSDESITNKFQQVVTPPRTCTPHEVDCLSYSSCQGPQPTDESSSQGYYSAVTPAPSLKFQDSDCVRPAAPPFSFDPSSFLGTSISSMEAPNVSAGFEACEDRMIFSGDVLMCSYTLRTQNAMFAGACSEVNMRGIARVEFSPSNKIENIEFMYDSMGLMHQLVNASGRDSSIAPVVVPHNLEMALTPHADEARALTLATPPFAVIHVNEAWTKMTQYSQIDAEGSPLSSLLNIQQEFADFNTEVFLNSTCVNTGIREKDFCRVARGHCTYNASKYRDRAGNVFVASVSSYPLAKDHGDVEHILHVFKKLDDVMKTPTSHSLASLLPSSICIPIRCPSISDAESEKQIQDEISYTDTLSGFYGGRGSSVAASMASSVVSAETDASSSSISSGSASSRGKRKFL